MGEIILKDISPATEEAVERALEDLNIDHYGEALAGKSASTSVTSNTVALTLDVSSRGSPRGILEVAVKSSTSATYKVQGSLDNSTWRDKDSISHSAGSTEETVSSYWNAYPYLRVKSDDNIASHEIDIVTTAF